MKKKSMNTNAPVVEMNEETTISTKEIGATNSHLRTLISEICTDSEFAILRETLRLYCEEVQVH